MRYVIGVGFLYLAACMGMLWFCTKLEAHEPIEEIEVTFRQPMTARDMLIAACPQVLGEAQVFLDCYKKVDERLSD